MTKTFRRILFLALLLSAIAAAIFAYAMTGGCTSSTVNPLNNAKNGAINAALDATGVKEQIDSELRNRAGAVAAEYGISQAVVDDVVDSLAITEWKATELPKGVEMTGTYTVTDNAASTTITTYDDPSVVTVDMYGQSVTLSVPESAQAYVPYFQYFQYFQ